MGHPNLIEINILPLLIHNLLLVSTANKPTLPVSTLLNLIIECTVLKFTSGPHIWSAIYMDKGYEFTPFLSIPI